MYLIGGDGEGKPALYEYNFGMLQTRFHVNSPHS